MWSYVNTLDAYAYTLEEIERQKVAQTKELDLFASSVVSIREASRAQVA